MKLCVIYHDITRYIVIACPSSDRCPLLRHAYVLSRGRAVFIGPADCNHCKCDHRLFSESSNCQAIVAQVLKHFVVTIVAVTVRWSSEVC